MPGETVVNNSQLENQPQEKKPVVKNEENKMDDELAKLAQWSEDPPEEQNGTNADVAAAPAMNPEEAKKTGNEKIQLGQKLYALRDFSRAADSFEAALEILVPVHGDMALELANVYYMYGTSILEQNRAEGNIFGGGGSGADKDAEEAEDDDDADILGVEGDRTKALGASGHEEEIDQAKPTEEAEVDLVEAKSKGKDAADGDGGAQAADEEAIENLQIAFECLETARVIWEKASGEDTSSTEHLPMLIKCHERLAECAAESNAYPQAIADYAEGIKLHIKLHGDKDGRGRAHLHFQKALMHENVKEHKEAISNLEKAIEILESRKLTMKAQATTGGDKAAQELKDLDAIIGDVNRRLQEVRVDEKEFAKLTSNLKDSVKEAFGGLVSAAVGSSAGGSSSAGASAGNAPAAPANDLTSLVRKRKKEAVKEDEEPQKAPKTE
eukprot:Clim_evm49s215 gene=Clim_evmTU49s215